MQKCSGSASALEAQGPDLKCSISPNPKEYTYSI